MSGVIPSYFHCYLSGLIFKYLINRHLIEYLSSHSIINEKEIYVIEIYVISMSKLRLSLNI